MSVTRNNIHDVLFDKQLEIIGKTRLDYLDDDKWWWNWTMTEEQYIEYEKWAIPLLMKVFHYKRGKARSTFHWFYKTFGVRIIKRKSWVQ